MDEGQYEDDAVDPRQGLEEVARLGADEEDDIDALRMEHSMVERDLYREILMENDEYNLFSFLDPIVEDNLENTSKTKQDNDDRPGHFNEDTGTSQPPLPWAANISKDLTRRERKEMLAPITDAVPVDCVLEWIYGARVCEASQLVQFSKVGEIVYVCGRVVIVYDEGDHSQWFYREHTADIIALAMHPVVDVVATGELAVDPQIHIWDLETMRSRRVFKCKEYFGVCGLSFSPDGDLLLAVGMDPDHTVKIYNWKKDSMAAVCEAASTGKHIWDAKWFSDTEFVLIGDHVIQLWEVVEEKGESGFEFVMYSEDGVIPEPNSLHTITCMCLVPWYGMDQQRVQGFNVISDVVLVTGTAHGHLYVWDRNVVIASVLDAHSGPIYALSGGWDVGSLVSTGQDGHVRIWRIRYDNEEREYTKTIVTRGKELQVEKKFYVQVVTIYMESEICIGVPMRTCITSKRALNYDVSFVPSFMAYFVEEGTGVMKEDTAQIQEALYNLYSREGERMRREEEARAENAKAKIHSNTIWGKMYDERKKAREVAQEKMRQAALKTAARNKMSLREKRFEEMRREKLKAIEDRKKEEEQFMRKTRARQAPAMKVDKAVPKVALSTTSAQEALRQVYEKNRSVFYMEGEESDESSDDDQTKKKKQKAQVAYDKLRRVSNAVAYQASTIKAFGHTQGFRQLRRISDDIAAAMAEMPIFISDADPNDSEAQSRQKSERRSLLERMETKPKLNFFKSMDNEMVPVSPIDENPGGSRLERHRLSVQTNATTASTPRTDDGGEDGDSSARNKEAGGLFESSDESEAGEDAADATYPVVLVTTASGHMLVLRVKPEQVTRYPPELQDRMEECDEPKQRKLLWEMCEEKKRVFKEWNFESTSRRISQFHAPSLWLSPTFRETNRLWGGLCTHPQEPYYASGALEGVLHLWNYDERRHVAMRKFDHEISVCEYSNDGDMIGVGFYNGTWAVVDAITLEVLFGSDTDVEKSIVNTHPVLAMKWSPEEPDVLAIATPPGHVTVYEVLDKREAARRQRKAKEMGIDPAHIEQMQIKDERYKAENVHLTHYQIYHRQRLSSHPISNMDWSVDGSYLQCATLGDELVYFDLEYKEQRYEFEDFTMIQWHTHNCPVGWNLQGVAKWFHSAAECAVVATDVSKDMEFVASVTNTGVVQINFFPALGPAKTVKATGHSAHIQRVKWNFDDSHIFTLGGRDLAVYQWVVEDVINEDAPAHKWGETAS